MKHTSSILSLLFVAMLVIFNVGCTAFTTPATSTGIPILGSDVFAVSTRTVIWGMTQAIQAVQSGTVAGAGILTNPAQTQYVFYWSVRGVGLGFIGIDANTGNTFDVMAQLFKGGNIASCKSVKELLASLEQGGWSKLPQGAVPLIIAQAVENTGYILSSAASTVASRMTTPVFFVLPFSILENLIDPNYLECEECEISS